MWALLGILLLCSCNTFDAVQQAPEGFWLALERILLAVVEDVASVVGLLL